MLWRRGWAWQVVVLRPRVELVKELGRCREGYRSTNVGGAWYGARSGLIIMHLHEMVLYGMAWRTGRLFMYTGVLNKFDHSRPHLSACLEVRSQHVDRHQRQSPHIFGCSACTSSRLPFVAASAAGTGIARLCHPALIIYAVFSFLFCSDLCFDNIVALRRRCILHLDVLLISSGRRRHS